MSSQKYTNEMNAFRSGIERNIANHKDKTAAINQALGVKAQKVFQQGKTLADAGGKLLESGVGVAGTSGPLGALVRKGVTKFNEIKETRLGEAQDIADKIKLKGKSLMDRASAKGQDILDTAKSKVSQISDVAEGKAADAADSLRGSTSQVTDIANSVKTKASQVTPVDGDETKGDDAYEAEGKVGDTIEGRSLDQTTAYEYGDEGQEAAMAARDAGSGLPEASPGGATAAGEGSAVQGVGADSTGGIELPKFVDMSSSGPATSDAPTVQSGSAEAGTPDAAATTDTADALTTTLEDTGAQTAGKLLATGGTDAIIAGTFEEAAAATSWLAWLGVPEVLAAAGAIAGVAGAVSGVVDSVQGGDKEAAAQAMKTTAPAKTAQLAGSFVTPTQDSLT